MLPACGLAQLGRLTGGLTFDVVELSDPVEGFLRDLGRLGLLDIMEVTTQMSPAGCLAELTAAISAWGVERIEAGIGICLKDAAAISQMALRVFAFQIRGEAVDETGWRRTGPRPLVWDIGPNPPLLNPLSEAAVPT